MQIRFDNVMPIYPGYDATITIRYAQDFWDACELGTGRLVAHFRERVESALIATADSASGSIERVEEDKEITIRLTAAQTAQMASHSVVFDFIRVDGATKTPIPGRWQWPVLVTVTRNVA
jgi:hypothetical protein